MAKPIFDVYAAREGSEAFVTLTLPASAYQLLDAKERLHAEDGEELYLEISDYHACEYLSSVLNEQFGLMPLNALAERISQMDDRALTAFHGMVRMELDKGGESISPQCLLDLAHSTDCCHVVDALTDAELGRFYAENGFRSELDALPDKVFELLDFDKIGKEIREGECGVFTPDGYVVQHSEFLSAPPVPDRWPEKPDYIFRMELEHGGRAAVLELPALECLIDVALHKIGAGEEPVRLAACDSALPNFKQMFDGNLYAANELAVTVSRLEKAGRLPLYKAVLSAAECADISAALTLSEQLDHFMLDRTSASPAEYARNEIGFLLDGGPDAELLSQYVSLHAYGQALLTRQNAALTPYGVVNRDDNQPMQAPFEQPAQSGMEMM